MLKLISELFSLLTSSQKRMLIYLQALVIIMSFTEVISIVSIAPFMSLLGDPSLLNGNGILAKIYSFSGVHSPKIFTAYLGMAVVVCLTIASLVSAFTLWRLSLFAAHIGASISSQLYKHYMNRPWIYHASTSSAELIKKTAHDAQAVSTEILQPLIQMNAKLVFSVSLMLFIFFYNPMVAIICILLFTLSYVLLYRFMKNRLHNNGHLISNHSKHKYRLMNEGFGGIQDVLLLGRQEQFIQDFSKNEDVISSAYANNNILATIPRYFIELITFGSMITLVIYLIYAYDNQLSQILPLLSIYALAGFKLLPNFQQIYQSVARIKAYSASYEAIKKDIRESKSSYNEPCKSEVKQVASCMSFEDNICLENISFNYPNKCQKALTQINLSIAKNSIIGIVGPSGSGKSTLISLLTGLLDPTNGAFKIDDVTVSKNNKRLWQNMIGFVPQSIFLTEGSIAENIAFGIKEKEIDLPRVKQVLKLSHLDELVNSLGNNINTLVGERGVRLSGGQRQRIGIARALYHDPQVLIFDEATSALDGITENLIMEAIQNFSGKKTIIMVAHRLKTVKHCDNIFFLENGGVIDCGTYDELLKKNANFEKMTEHA